jgi:hypothetical protein
VTTIPERMAWWLMYGDICVCSETLYCAFTGEKPEYHCVPQDPEDFRRCKALLDLIPEWRAELPKIAAVLPYWKPIIDQWDELEKLLSDNPKRLFFMHDYMRPTVRACEDILDSEGK